MDSSDVRPARVRTAIALSIAAHVCGLGILAVLLVDRPAPRSSLTDSDPLGSVTTIVHRERAPERDRRATPASAPLRPHPVAAARPTPFPERRQVFRAPLAASPHPAHVGHSLAHQPRKPARALALAVVGVSTPLPTPPSPTPPPPSPTPTPAAATPTPTAAGSAALNFGGLFSQNYPPAFAAPADLAALRSQLREHVHIRVDVDETGHATEVRFVSPLSDETLAQEVRSALLALHYVPADCNGLHCEGTLEINY